MRFLEPSLTKIERLQWLVLGLLLGMKDLRERVNPSDFSFPDFQRAHQELQDGSGFSSLSHLMSSAGVEWEPSRTPPFDAILSSLKRDGLFAILINLQNEIIHETHTQDGECMTDRYIGRMRSLWDAVRYEQLKCDDPAAAKKEQESRMRELDKQKHLPEEF